MPFPNARFLTVGGRSSSLAFTALSASGPPESFRSPLPRTSVFPLPPWPSNADLRGCHRRGKLLLRVVQTTRQNAPVDHEWCRLHWDGVSQFRDWHDSKSGTTSSAGEALGKEIHIPTRRGVARQHRAGLCRAPRRRPRFTCVHASISSPAARILLQRFPGSNAFVGLLDFEAQ